MAKSGKLFFAMVGVLVLAIVGILFGIQKQQQVVSSHLRDRLEGDAQRSTLLAERAKVVIAQAPQVKSQLEQIETRWGQQQTRLYSEAARAEIEGLLKQTATIANLELVNIEVAPGADGEFLKEHVYNVRMTGPMSNLGAWTDALFRQRRLVKLDRVSVVANDGQVGKARIRTTLRFFEARDPESLAGPEAPLDQFHVDLSYVPQPADLSDPIYGASLVDAKQKVEALDGLQKDLADLARAERRLSGLTGLSGAVKSLDEQWRLNRQVATQNLPTLYLRVRSSPLGSAALTIQGANARFPETAGDD